MIQGPSPRSDRRHEIRVWRPKSDFLLHKDGLPRLLVQIQSQEGTTNAVGLPDENSMLLQGSHLVRFANRFVDQFKSDKSFVVVAYYIYEHGNLSRYIIFEKDQTVSPLLDQRGGALTLLRSSISVMSTLWPIFVDVSSSYESFTPSSPGCIASA
jgi:hypothetical protein